MVLEGTRILLVPFESRYITEDYVFWLRDPAVGAHLVKAASDTTLEDVRAFCNEMIESRDDFFFAITLRDNGRHIGNVRLGSIDWDAGSSHFGMMIGDVSLHGQGIGREVMELINTFCFETLALSRLAFSVVRRNVAAVRLYEKCGFSTKRPEEKLFKDGKSMDLIAMTMSAEDYFARKGLSTAKGDGR